MCTPGDKPLAPFTTPTSSVSIGTVQHGPVRDDASQPWRYDGLSKAIASWWSTLFIEITYHGEGNTARSLTNNDRAHLPSPVSFSSKMPFDEQLHCPPAVRTAVGLDYPNVRVPRSGDRSSESSKSGCDETHCFVHMDPMSTRSARLIKRMITPETWEAEPSSNEHAKAIVQLATNCGTGPRIVRQKQSMVIRSPLPV